MKPNDSQHNLVTNPIPELIKHLWDLYMAMSLDPALAASAEHVKQAALVLEHTRQLAFQVSQDAAKQQNRNTRRKRARSTARDEAAAAWLRTAKAGSQLKH